MNQINTPDDVVDYAKKHLTKYGQLSPTLLIYGSTGNEVAPLPDLAEEMKLSLLEAFGYTLASEQRIGQLDRLFLLAEGWRSTRNGPHASLRPQHDPDRIESLMVFCYQAADDSRRMVLYDQVRDQRGELVELKALPEAENVESPPLDAFIRGFKRGRDAHGGTG